MQRAAVSHTASHMIGLKAVAADFLNPMKVGSADSLQDVCGSTPPCQGPHKLSSTETRIGWTTHGVVLLTVPM